MTNALTIIYTSLALIAFAGNSVLCRLALGEGAIDAGSFTIVRLSSGSLVLFVLIVFNKGSKANASDDSLFQLKERTWLAPAALFCYAIFFSYAYNTLDTGTGALILFGAVQITMLLAGLLSGSRLQPLEWAGLCLAFIGFVYLLLPSVETPTAIGFGLMTLSGIAWGVYTLIGRGTRQPVLDTTRNFLGTLPLVAILFIFTLGSISITYEGVWLAIASGAIASGLGYFIWFKALPKLSITTAAVVQLSVPMLAAGGGVVFSNEDITMRLTISSVMVLGGIFVVVLGKGRTSKAHSS